MDIRKLFTDRKSVFVYPDDFDNEKTILFPDLVNRATGHFSDQRIVVFFRPGTYQDINFPVGYWTQALGLGENPSDVLFEGELGVYCIPANTDNPGVGSLDTFWRSAENFTTNASFVLNDENKWSVPIVQNDDAATSLQGPPFPHLYPVDDLSDNPQATNFSAQIGMMWAVSQAAPIRRVQVGGNLHLSLGDNNSSGGFIGNVDMTKNGYLVFGSQQQFCVRNCAWKQGKAFAGAWSLVLSGCEAGNGDGDDPPVVKHHGSTSIPPAWVGNEPLVVNEPNTSTRIEKPFLFLGPSDDDPSKMVTYLAIPGVQKDSTGVDFNAPTTKVLVDNKEQVKVFTPDSSFEEVQAAAKAGTHIVLSPGTYNWKETLKLTNDTVTNQVVLGVGMATIQAPGTGGPCIHVSSATSGVRISGLALEASVISKFVYEGSTLLQWGEKERIGKGNSDKNPGVIHDLFCFVGGRSLDRTVKVQTMVKIYSSHVVGDNLWLWRADHVKLLPNEQPNRPELSEYHVTTYGECECDTGLEVFGDNVIFYGLAIEHTYKDMLLWHGKDGAVYFYQSEMPYDVPGSAYKESAGYHVLPGANGHTGKGLGVYTYFRDYADVVVPTAVVNSALSATYENVFSVWLNGHSGVESVMNGRGGIPTPPGNPSSLKSFKGKGHHILSPWFWQGLWKKLRRES